MRYLLLALGSLTIIGIALLSVEYYAYFKPIQGALPDTETFKSNIDWGRCIGQGFALLAGVIFAYFYDRFQKLQQQNIDQVDIGTEAKGMFRSTQFYLALSASPILFSVVIIGSQNVTLLISLMFAFQNGFFWKTVFPSKPTAI